MLQYPATLTRDTNDSILVKFPDIPEALTFGVDEDEALTHAADALETALSMYVDDRREIPVPSKLKRGQRYVAVRPMSEAKLGLYMAMRARRTSKAELARLLNCHMPQVDRLLDLMHASRFEQLETALRAVGKTISIQVSDFDKGVAA